MPGEPGLWRFLIPLYKSIVLAALLLIIILIIWAFTVKRPGLPADTPLWQVNLTHSVHALHYMMMLIMLLMGFAVSAATASEFEFFGLFIVPNVIDEKNCGDRHLLDPLHYRMGFCWSYRVSC